jgi:hypothetical protein
MPWRNQVENPQDSREISNGKRQGTTEISDVKTENTTEISGGRHK